MTTKYPQCEINDFLPLQSYFLPSVTPPSLPKEGYRNRGNNHYSRTSTYRRFSFSGTTPYPRTTLYLVHQINYQLGIRVLNVIYTVIFYTDEKNVLWSFFMIESVKKATIQIFRVKISVWKIANDMPIFPQKRCTFCFV